MDTSNCGTICCSFEVLRSELTQYLAQRRPSIGGAGQAAALQRGNQPLRYLIDETATGALKRRADQESVATDRLLHQAHAFGHRIRRADELQFWFHRLEAFHRELAQCLAATPLGEFVGRSLLAVRCQMCETF